MRFIEIINKQVRVKTVKTDTETWFDDIYVNNKKLPREVMKDKMYIPGKIYSFKYFADPKLKFYDLHPVVLLLYTKVVNNDFQLYCINLSLVPPLSKVKIIGKLYDFYYNKGIKTSIDNLNAGKATLKLNFDYKLVSTLLQNTGYQFSLSVYKHRKIIGKPRIITYDDWWKPCLLTPKYIKKINSSALYKLYNMEKENSQALEQAEQKAIENNGGDK